MTFNTDRQTDRETDRHAGMPVVILHTCVRSINSNKSISTVGQKRRYVRCPRRRCPRRVTWSIIPDGTGKQTDRLRPMHYARPRTADGNLRVPVVLCIAVLSVRRSQQHKSHCIILSNATFKSFFLFIL